MNEIDIEKSDLNLLKVFRILMQERSLTATADRLSVGQPAISHALARLRDQFDDPLFVRAGRQMTPTRMADALDAEVSPALDRIELALRASVPFDPETAERTFRLGLSDDLQMAFLPNIIAALRRRIPAAKLIVQQTDYRQAPEMLEKRQVSAVIGYLDKLPATAKVRKIRRVGYRLVTRASARPPTTLDAYCAGDHALVTFAGDLVGYVDETLAKRRRARSVVISLSSFAVLPAILADSDYMATVPEYLADRLAERPELRAADLPFKSPEFDISIAWPATADRDPGDMYLRRLLIEMIKDQDPNAEPGSA